MLYISQSKSFAWSCQWRNMHIRKCPKMAARGQLRIPWKLSKKQKSVTKEVLHRLDTGFCLFLKKHSSIGRELERSDTLPYTITNQSFVNSVLPLFGHQWWICRCLVHLMWSQVRFQSCRWTVVHPRSLSLHSFLILFQFSLDSLWNKVVRVLKKL